MVKRLSDPRQGDALPRTLRSSGYLGTSAPSKTLSVLLDILEETVTHRLRGLPSPKDRSAVTGCRLSQAAKRGYSLGFQTIAPLFLRCTSFWLVFRGFSNKLRQASCPQPAFPVDTLGYFFLPFHASPGMLCAAHLSRETHM